MNPNPHLIERLAQQNVAIAERQAREAQWQSPRKRGSWRARAIALVMALGLLGGSIAWLVQ